MAKDPLVGRQVGNYRILEKVGEGGYATVYRGIQTSLKREVAIKVMRHHAASDNMLRRFRRESQTVAKMRHPNIVEVHDYIELEEELRRIMAIDPEGEGLREDALESLAFVALETHLARVEGIREAEDGSQAFESQLEAVETAPRAVAH